MRAETDVVGIRLDDAASAVKVIGSSEAPGFPEPEPKDGSALPFVRFVNKSGDETLKLTRYRGAAPDTYETIEVTWTGAGPEGNVRHLPFDAFKTERGVALGMKLGALTALLGPCYDKHAGRAGEAMLHYRIEDPAHPLLQRVHKQGYWADYRFRDGALIDFQLSLEAR